MNQASRGSRAVFVGNIPFEYTEEQLIDVFKEVGPVSSFRLLFDRDSGRPKGYGFCEYYDAETAASAVRNLNDYEIGGRQLRVDYASMDDNHRSNSHGSHNNSNQFAPQQQQQQPPPPPMNQPPPMSRPTGPVSSVEEIPKVLNTMTPQDLLTIMGQMKQLSMERPEHAREFLTANPQVTYALFQAMTMMNVVDPNVISRLIASMPQVPQAPPPMQSMPQGLQQQQPPYMPAQQVMPPQQAMPSQQTMPPQQASDAAAAEQKALLMQVLQLSEEQINNLQPEYRDQVRQLRAQLTMQQQQP
ncbi:RNA-binding protein [Halteromyces radiatus]|uniref:RNA-binding protein n=1 Tax=Halteromyces radiatus TaxID=101107 RepID=UPI00221ED290|nr:RNA-binding protein [Halteromyces radiatus]KAI8098656.1 RNA-binding protein [Halteromyces radiatus]